MFRIFSKQKFNTNPLFTRNFSDSIKKITLEDYNPQPIGKIRNFCIIAHIDHGKSTLADRMIEFCGYLKLNQHQVLDKLQVERDRGITVKAQTCTMMIKSEIGMWLIWITPNFLLTLIFEEIIIQINHISDPTVKILLEIMEIFFI